MRVELRSISGVPILHETPLARVIIEKSRVVVELDDEDEKRIRLTFKPYQAVRVTTIDCFDLPGRFAVLPKQVSELVPSPWIKELTAVLGRVDHTATFMQKAKHFVIPAQDDVIEVIAWAAAWEHLPPQ